MHKRRMLLGALALLAAGCSKEPEKPKRTYPFPIAGKITVVNFGAPDIAYCPEQTETMQHLQDKYGDLIDVMDVDINKFPGIENEFHMSKIPFQLFYDGKGLLVWGHNGIIDVDEMSEFVDRLLEGPTPAAK